MSITISFLFYLTPVFWHSTQIPEEWRIWLKINPLHYIVTGYRDSFIYQKPFWINWEEGIYFWVTSCLFFVVGVFVFKKLKPHFADVI